MRLQDPDPLVIGRYGSADPDPYQNVTDPQHWLKQIIRRSNKSVLQFDSPQVFEVPKPNALTSVPDPDPPDSYVFVLGLSDPDPSLIKQKNEKNLDSYSFVVCFVTSFGLLSLKNDVNVASKSNKQKNDKIFFWLPSWRSLVKIAGSGSESGLGSLVRGMDPRIRIRIQNIMDPEHWL